MSKKRKLFNELMEGVEAMQAQREGKISLPAYKRELPVLPEVTPELIRETREQLHLSRPIFARQLHVASRTLENWEQGRSKPSHQAAALILLVRKYPDTIERLVSLENA